MSALLSSGRNEYTRLRFSGHQSSVVSFSFLVQDQLHQKDGMSIYPIIDTNKTGMVGTKLLDKLTLPKAGAAYWPMLMDRSCVVTLVSHVQTQPCEGPSSGAQTAAPCASFPKSSTEWYSRKRNKAIQTTPKLHQDKESAAHSTPLVEEG